MLIAVDLENFKGIAARQRIDFAPLTLLFGANSAGKSTILQALLYLHEILERGSADVDRTERGGEVLDLGGFARLVHRHEVNRTIVLRAEFATPGGLERFGRDLTDFPFPDLDAEVESAWLELTIRLRTSPAFRGPLVDRAVIGVNGDDEPLVWIETGTSLREGEPLRARVNLGHPLLATETRELPDALVTEADGTQRSLQVRHAPAEITEAWQEIAIPDREPSESRSGSRSGARTHSVSRSRTGATTRSVSRAGSDADAGLGDGSGFGDGRALPVFALARSRLSALPPPGEPLRVIPFGDESAEKAAATEQVRTFLEMVVLGTTAQLVASLRDVVYVGPLRTIPPRGFLYERAGRTVSWADGLAAWDLLLADRGSLVERTNLWLRRLGTGCRVVVQQLFDRGADAEDLTDRHVDKTVRRLLLDTGAGSFVLPSEVGAGISQVIPVLVAALDERSSLVMIEHPDIHVHPAVQVGLGDLFIEASRGRQLVVETHSEHLMLRLLRRIRETTDGELEPGAPSLRADQLSVLCVEADPAGARITRAGIDETGEFDRGSWPRGFFRERAKELF